MIKSVFKEIGIVILIIIVIALVLGILLYDYNPTSQKVPNKLEAYVLSNEVQEELENTLAAKETQNIIKTYKVDGRDLQVYEDGDVYVPGKVNPFSPVDSTENNNVDSNTTGDNNNQGGKFINTAGK